MVLYKKIKMSDDCEKRKVSSRTSLLIDHSFDTYSNFKSLVFDDQLTDVTLVVEGEGFNCHKLIFASQSCYFRSLFFGPMKESTLYRIELKDISKSTFKLLLNYIYTGQVNLDRLSEDDILDLIQLSSCYCLDKLKSDLTQFVIKTINPSVAIKYYCFARLHLINDLTEFSLNYIDNNASDILSEPSFNNTPIGVVEELLSRDSFYAQEVTIFNSLVNYSIANQLSIEKTMFLIQSLIRFSFISFSQLKKQNLCSYGHWNKALVLFHELKATSPPKEAFRGQLVFDTNFGLNVDGFKVIKGKPLSIFDIASIRISNVDLESYIEFKLGSKYFINHIKMLAYIEPDFHNHKR